MIKFNIINNLLKKGNEKVKEKEVIKINLSSFFIILAILGIIILGIYIYKIYNEKVEENKKTLDNISNDSTSFTDKQIKTTLSNFLELRARANCDSLLEYLTEKGKLNYNSSKDIIQNDGIVVTTIKFSDYKNAMLNYLSESEFEKNWFSTLYFSENSNGYITKIQGGGGLRVYTINNIKKIDNSTYFAQTTATLVDFDDSEEDENFTFTIKSYKGNCVIDTIK